MVPRIATYIHTLQHARGTSFFWMEVGWKNEKMRQTEDLSLRGFHVFHFLILGGLQTLASTKLHVESHLQVEFGFPSRRKHSRIFVTTPSNNRRAQHHSNSFLEPSLFPSKIRNQSNITMKLSSSIICFVASAAFLASSVQGFAPATPSRSSFVAMSMSTMADSGVPAETSQASDVADAEIPTNLPSECGMDYIPLATMLATGQLAEADQVS